jgi:hypothetical protein
MGNGSVTIDMFYTVANDTGFFLRYLKLNSFLKMPQVDSAGNLVVGETNPTASVSTMNQYSANGDS